MNPLKFGFGALIVVLLASVEISLHRLDLFIYRQVKDIPVKWDHRWGEGTDGVVPFSLPLAEDEKLRERLAMLVSVSSRLSHRLFTVLKLWNTSYHWPTRAAELNRLGEQYTHTINGLQLHYYHLNRLASIPKPLLLLHRWPVTFSKVMPHLLEFPLVVPNLAGGFGEDKEFSFVDVAVVLGKLMHELYPEKPYLCHGSDEWSSALCSCLGQIDTANVLGVHLTSPLVLLPPRNVGGPLAWVGIHALPFIFTELVTKVGPTLPQFLARVWQETGMFHFAATKPEVVAVGFSESPVFLLAWVLDQVDSRGNHEVELTTLLDVVEVIWRTGWNSQQVANEAALTSLLAPVPVPTGVLEGPKEMFRVPRSWLSGYRFPNLVRHRETRRGGHFLALEFPQDLAEDLKAFIGTLEVGTVSK